MLHPSALSGPADRVSAARDAGASWLVLVHQLPTRPSHIRVKTWRRLQQVGAIPLRSSVYVLPHTAGSREDFEWIASEVRALGGQATLLDARPVDPREDDEMRRLFVAASTRHYDALLRELEAADTSASRRRLTVERRERLSRDVQTFAERLERVSRTDFFGAPGRAAVEAAIERLQDRLNRRDGSDPAGAALEPLDPQEYRGRTWVTRPRPGVDRMGSAWLIRRFIDGAARFAFAQAETSGSTEWLPFDTFGAEFGHHGDRCTFETLLARFGIEDPAAARLAHVVHDLDLKDSRYGLPEAIGLGVIVDGLQGRYRDDAELLEQGIVVFDALYESVRSTLASGRAGGRGSAQAGSARDRKHRG